MNIALFGGTFDPIHRGHLAVARAAQRRFKLREVLFVPACVSPLKRGQPALRAGEIVSSGTLTAGHLTGPGDTWTAELEGIPFPNLSLIIVN